MSNTPNTGIPYVPEATLDPAAGLNLALNVIDALLQTAVITIGDAEPPSSSEVADGDLYIVGIGTGDWEDEDDNLARYVSDGDFWQFYAAGDQVRIVFNQDDSRIYVWMESDGWQPYPVLDSLEDAANDAAAASAGVAVGAMYRNGSVLMIRVS